MKLGPTRSFGRDALRRVLARNEYIVIEIFERCRLTKLDAMGRTEAIAIATKRGLIRPVS